MTERCRGEYVRYHSPKYPNCTADATFRLDWQWANGPGKPKGWYSFACPHHLAQVVRWALAQKGVAGPISVKNMSS